MQNTASNESSLSYEQVEKIVRPVLQCNDPDGFRLTVQAFQQCVFGKVFPPEPPLNHNWISPGGKYRGQWIWDTMFVCDLMSIFPGRQEIIRGVFQNYWDTQARWNAVHPPYAHNMIPCSVKPTLDGRAAFTHNFTQLPLLGWGLERVFMHNGDEQLVRNALAPIERYHEWFWRERDICNNGLISVGSYSGLIQDARYESYDLECNLDDLELTRHPADPMREGVWYGNICVPGVTAYLILAENCLARLAEKMGDEGMAARRRARADRSAQSMRTFMWDPQVGTFLAVWRDSLEKIPVPTIGSWMPLMAGVPDETMAARMVKVLDTPEWMTPLPVPTVGRNDSHWGKGRFKNGYIVEDLFWRGDVWPVTNYQVAVGLARYGYHDLAARIADTTIKNAMKQGINERYHCDTGKPLGVKNLGMSSTIVTMMLDGLSRKYCLKLSLG